MSSRQQAKEEARARRLTNLEAIHERSLGDEKERSYTVFAVYEDNFQPYSATVIAPTPEIAVHLAQEQCLEDNGTEPIGDGPFRYGSCTLVGFQIVEGIVETISFDDMPLEVGDDVSWSRSKDAPWDVEAILTNAPELRARIRYGSLEAIVPASELSPYPNV